MKSLIILILFLFSVKLIGQLAYPYKVYSENNDFFIKSIPFTDQFKEKYGKTIVCRASDSLQVLYTIPKYFQPDKLFISNDGLSVCFISNSIYPIPVNWDRNVIFFYNEGNLIKTYHLDQFIDSSLNRYIDTLLYKTAKSGLNEKVRYAERVSVKVKKKINLTEEYLKANDSFVINNLIYILTQDQTVNIFDLRDGRLIKKQSIKDFTNDSMIYPKPRRIEKTEIIIPDQITLPKLSDGNDYASKFAERMNLTSILDVGFEDFEKYKVYYCSIILSIDTLGFTNNIQVKSPDTLLRNNMYEFLKNSTFDKSLIPKGIEMWYFKDLPTFRKKSEETALKEREQDRVNELAKLNRSSSPDTLNGVYIPKDLEDCFYQLNKMLSDDSKNELKEYREHDVIGQLHFSLGLWIRNNWGLWGDSRLKKYFNSLDVWHPDDMSGIILVSYHRYLNKKNIRLDKQIKQVNDYWKKAKKIVPDTINTQSGVYLR